MGATSISLLLVPTLKVDLTNAAICSGKFYEGLLGYNGLSGHSKALGPATIALPRPN